MKLSSSKVYGIDRRVIVTNGATLAGCSLYSFLVISSDSKIMVKGSKNQPIIFTSQLDLHGFSKSDSSPGEWGGLV